MRHNLRHFKLSIIILALAALSWGGGGKVNLCLMPGGEVHMEQSHSPCGLAGNRLATAEALTLNNNRVEDQGHHCLDVPLGGEASNPHQINFVQLPVPAMVPLGPPIVLALIDKKPFSFAPALTPPQLASLQSVVLLI